MINNQIQALRKDIPNHVEIIAVSKTKSNEAILAAYESGQRAFGENKVQELTEKYEQLPKDIKWHFIGHLQRNKVKYIIPFVHMLHCIDSMRLLEKINQEAQKQNRVVNGLLQFHIAEEESKFGLSLDEAKEILESDTFKNLKNVNICGVMGMATFTDDEEQINNEFQYLKEIFNTLKNNYFAENPDFKEISMGMSSDYQIAINQGSTMVRIGSLIFGSRY